MNDTRLERTLRAARQRLLAFRTPAGHWEGELSASALSTATAAWALALVDRKKGADRYAGFVGRALDWLAQNQNDDGGWGDTVFSKSNISTTLLGWSALAASDGSANHARAVAAAEAWLRRHVGGLEPERLARAVDARYGNDRTFSAPILTMCALAGRLGPEPDAWRPVYALPFELAALPHAWWKHLHLRVVSYALPALIAVGQARYHGLPPRNPAARLVRRLARRRTLELLTSIQPASGGFLEAAPLTSFVTMSLAAAGHADHEVAARAAGFLCATNRHDGSWPVDTNLATWVTTLAVSALVRGPALDQALPAAERQKIVQWLLGQQCRTEHPYTHVAPGGWAWTDLAGGVPDADDTAGALAALRHLGAGDPQAREAAARGVTWLLDLQNRDGGIPTFCRGWGLLAFDRSAPDLTAHAVTAWTAWLADLPGPLRGRAEKAIARALAYLERVQRPEGEWVPLWFGNQFADDEENPTYGTSRVLAALAPLAAIRGGQDCPPRSTSQGERGGQDCPPRDGIMVARGIRWLLAAQNWDGGWGGSPAAPSSIEETALAIDALAQFAAPPRAPSSEPANSPLRGGSPDPPRADAPGALVRGGSAEPPREGITGHDAISQDALRHAVTRGAAWLMARTEEGTSFDPSPIGLYFARLWYFERLYPIIFTVAALERVRAADYTA
jgi:squalene-hopene/tetraprenyl-beta-curcumene cyclase